MCCSCFILCADAGRHPSRRQCPDLVDHKNEAQIRCGGGGLEVRRLKCYNQRMAGFDKLSGSPWDVQLAASATVGNPRDPRSDAQACPIASVMVPMVDRL